MMWRLRKDYRDDNGFTLMEMLIVIAIIAVLIAIAIPMFMNQMKAANVATNKANARSAYATAMAEQYARGNTLPALYEFDIASGQLTKINELPATFEEFKYEAKFPDWTNVELEDGIATKWQVIFYTDDKINLRAIFDEG